MPVFALLFVGILCLTAGGIVCVVAIIWRHTLVFRVVSRSCIILSLLGMAALMFAIFTYYHASCQPYGRCFVTEDPTYYLPWGNHALSQVSPLLDLDIYFLLDPLGALFILITSMVGTCILLYGWVRLQNDLRSTIITSMYSLLLAGLILCFVLDHAIWLLFALELISFFLVPLLLNHDSDTDQARLAHSNAAEEYLNISHLSNLLLLVALLILGVNSGTAVLSRMVQPTHNVNQIAFALAWVALNIRAGIFPFHGWIASVHPHLPTHVHALVSSVVLKLPVYLMLRFFFQYLGPVPAFWGALQLVLAGITAYLTVGRAISTRNMKRTLALHSSENICLILLSISMALLLRAPGITADVPVSAAAAVALMAGLYHTLNHALFKSLLFLGLASMERSFETVDKYAFPQVARISPWLALTFLIGCLAIIGVPGTNGFISKALIVYSMIGLHAELTHTLFVVLTPVAIVLLALAFIFTLVAFGFLAREVLFTDRRDPLENPETVRKINTMELGILFVLAMFCIILGLVPGIPIAWFQAICSHLGMDISGLTGDWIFLRLSLVTKDGNLAFQPTASVINVVLILGTMTVTYVLLRKLMHTRITEPTSGGESPVLNIPLREETILAQLLQTMPALKPIESNSLPLNFLTDPLAILRDSSRRFAKLIHPGETGRYTLYILIILLAILLFFIFYFR